MIGLCRGLAFLSYREFYPNDTLEEMAKLLQQTAETFPDDPFGMVSRREATRDSGYAISRRYFQLLDACPLRMSADQSSGW